MAQSEQIIERLVDAALMHVPFDGWSAQVFEQVVAECDVNPVVAKAICPRGATDLAVAYHKGLDRQMVSALQVADLSEMKFREKVAHAVRLRLELCEDKEVVRRGTTLFALPQNAATGTSLLWGTVDEIWTTLGDSSDDLNWYTKRTTLSGVYASTVLFWLGDDSEGHEATWAFLDRRIDNVMQFEKVKARVQNSFLGKALARPLEQLSRIQPPKPRDGFPGRWAK